MSIFDNIPEANNATNLVDTFPERYTYALDGFPIIDGVPQPIDFWQPVHFMYARVDAEGRATIPKDELIGFVGDSEILMFDFVAKAFSDLQEFVLRKQKQSKLPINNRFKLTATKSYQPHEEEYAGRQWSHFKTFLIRYLDGSNLRTITTYDQFEALFKKYVTHDQLDSALTETDYVLTADYNIMSTGLAIDVYDGDPTLDFLKFKLYLEDLTFVDFQHVAALFGFLVDRNNPWKLVANVTHPTMLEYAGVENLDEFFETYYTVVSNRELNNTKTMMNEFYKLFVEMYPFVISTKTGGNSATDLEALVNKKERTTTIPAYPDEHWLELFLYFKIAEKGRKRKDLTKELRTAMMLNRKYGINQSLQYINKL